MTMTAKAAIATFFLSAIALFGNPSFAERVEPEIARVEALQPVVIENLLATPILVANQIESENIPISLPNTTNQNWNLINSWLLSGLKTEQWRHPNLDLSLLAVSEDHFNCLATNIYFEARGSSIADQRAVAHVTINRARHRFWRGSVCDVVWERYQFSLTITASQPRNRVRDLASWRRAQEISFEILSGQIPDLTRGAVNYYNPRIVRPSWARLAVQRIPIGAHVYMILRTNRNGYTEDHSTPLLRSYANSIGNITSRASLLFDRVSS